MGCQWVEEERRGSCRFRISKECVSSSRTLRLRLTYDKGGCKLQTGMVPQGGGRFVRTVEVTPFSFVVNIVKVLDLTLAL